MQNRRHKRPNTSWEKVSKWYGSSTKSGGHYFHQHVILKRAAAMLGLSPTSRILDLGCGAGVLANIIPKEAGYTGVDSSHSLIKTAKQSDKNTKHIYIVADATDRLSIPNNFTHAVFMLSLQNMKDQQGALAEACMHMETGGKLLLILNHPVFRIPRQTSWGTDDANKMQYRRINRYLSPLEIPITMHPGKQNSAVTWSYHYPISSYAAFLKKAGFVIEDMQEWVSDKESVGKAARAENLARSEFPMFLAIAARKII
jgi:ubiquinone/menaquinone biosynthesis C-methylase UbiE